MSVTNNENSKQVAEVSINFPNYNLMKVGVLLKKCSLHKFRVVLNLCILEISHFVGIIVQILYI